MQADKALIKYYHGMYGSPMNVYYPSSIFMDKRGPREYAYNFT